MLCEYEPDDDNKCYKTYPFEITSKNNGIAILANHIVNYILNLSNEDLEQLDAIPTGDEEEYETGWYIFKPDWYSEQNGIEQYGFETKIAVKPILIKYGK